MARYQEEQEKKKRSAEAKEIIEAVGEEGQKGSRAAKEYLDEQVKEEKKKENTELSRLDSRRGFVDYNFLLAKLLVKRLNLVSWPEGWRYNVAPTKEGIVMELYSPDKFFRAGFRPTRTAMYDLNAVDMYAVRAENTIDRVTGADGANGEIVV